MTPKEKEKIIEEVLKDKDLSHLKKSKWWINIIEKALQSQKEKIIEIINEIDLSWFRQIINEKLPLEQSIKEFKEELLKSLEDEKQ